MSQQGSSSQPQAIVIDCYALTPLVIPSNNSFLRDDFKHLKIPSYKNGVIQQKSGEQEEKLKSRSFRPRARSYEKVLEWVCSDDPDEPAGTAAHSRSKEWPHHRKSSHDNFNPKRFMPLLDELLGEERPGEATLASMELCRKKAEFAITTALSATESKNADDQSAKSIDVSNKRSESL
ncbi:hypothetical protein Ddc_13622 [Ditylenchus destructor]|nr:hypothetical protein Ddc_13622 [Ditylenchus destructor]